MTERGPAVPLRLGVNIDHVATIRNARGGRHPEPIRAARLAVEAGADGITAHLREDRRHISDKDIDQLMSELDCPLNLEMAATDEMLAIALNHVPHACCIVPEKRQELTTEGGLDVAAQISKIRSIVERLQKKSIRVSLFIDPDKPQVEAAVACGADVIEIHTGTYCEAAFKLNDPAHGRSKAYDIELERISWAARYASELGLEVHAGHGLDYNSTGPIAEIPEIEELNIGHFLVGEAIFSGLDSSIKRMRIVMDNARAGISGVKSA